MHFICNLSIRFRSLTLYGPFSAVSTGLSNQILVGMRFTKIKSANSREVYIFLVTSDLKMLQMFEKLRQNRKMYSSTVVVYVFVKRVIKTLSNYHIHVLNLSILISIFGLHRPTKLWRGPDPGTSAPAMHSTSGASR